MIRRCVCSLLALSLGFSLGLEARAGDANAHDSFGVLLAKYVHGGRVDYRAWTADATDAQELADYVDRLESMDPEKMDSPDALAYWINLYNATTLELLLDHYPVDSIKDIGGLLSSPWKRELVAVSGEGLTLNEIENEIIRPRFADARIHFALNCAAVSCPPLQSFAFEGGKLDEQLERVTRAALADARFFDASSCVDGSGKLRLSRIFDWYADDFKAASGSIEAFARHYAGDVVEPGCKLDFMDYDWALNESSK
jgi:hypothetical protein